MFERRDAIAVELRTHPLSGHGMPGSAVDDGDELVQEAGEIRAAARSDGMSSQCASAVFTRECFPPLRNITGCRF